MNVAAALNVSAIVVSFNGGEQTLATVAALQAQVSRVHVVDNGSKPESVELLRQLSSRDGVVVTFLERNLGIAAALNIGLRAEREAGYTWVLTMDQDSILEPGSMDAYADALKAHPQSVCLVPNVLSNGMGSPACEGPVEFAITSGTLMKVTLLEEVGFFAEELFIDGVDIDYSLRIRRAGREIRRVRHATIRHELGEQVKVGWASRIYAAHSPLRRYYMYRNHLYLMKSHWRSFPGFILKASVYQVLLLGLVVLYDRERMRSLKFILKGVRDFFGGRMGPIREV
jgi:rhamnosyltransferase